MSYYSIIKLEIRAPYAERVLDDIRKADKDDYSKRSPDNMYETTYIEGDAPPRTVMLWCWNKAPCIDDFDDWLYSDLMISNDDFNIQKWGEDNGCHYDDEKGDYVDDPDARPESRGGLSPIWVLGHEFSEELPKIRTVKPDINVEYVSVGYDNGLTEQEYEAFKTKKEEMAYRDTIKDIDAILYEQKECLGYICGALKDISSALNGITEAISELRKG